MGVVRGSEVLIDPGRGRSATARIRGYESSTPHLGCFWGNTRNSIDLRSQQFMRLQRKCASPSHKALKESELPEFLEKLDAYDGNKLTQLAMRFLMLTFVRTGEMRGATWNEFDIEKAERRIPAERMKMGAEHIVPLSRQALEVIDELRPLSGTGAECPALDERLPNSVASPANGWGPPDRRWAPGTSRGPFCFPGDA